MRTYQLTQRDRRFFDQLGFLVLEGVLGKRELAQLNKVVDDLYRQCGGDPVTGRMELRNCMARHPLLLAMAEHRALLPAVVGLLGPDIKLRTSELDVRPPFGWRRWTARPAEPLG